VFQNIRKLQSLNGGEGKKQERFDGIPSVHYFELEMAKIYQYIPKGILVATIALFKKHSNIQHSVFLLMFYQELVLRNFYTSCQDKGDDPNF
jgi:hypothetical protein